MNHPLAGSDIQGWVRLCANILVLIERSVVFSSSASINLEHLSFLMSSTAVLFSLEKISNCPCVKLSVINDFNMIILLGL